MNGAGFFCSLAIKKLKKEKKEKKKVKKMKSRDMIDQSHTLKIGSK